jgi:hypothetical protein
MVSRKKAGTAMGGLSLAQGFVGIGVTFLPAEPNLTLAKWMFIGAGVCAIITLLIVFWPERTQEATQSATQSGSHNVQIQGHTVSFQGTISTGEGEVSTGRLPDGRTFVDVTPEYLTGLFKEHTSIQAAKLVEAFIGKWIRLEGSLRDVTAISEDKALVYFTSETFEYGTNVVMYFNDKATIENRLRVLKKGDQIAVIGQIQYIISMEVGLENCELEKP